MERNTLMAKCYPKIKDYCREKHGLEFQVTKEPKKNFHVFPKFNFLYDSKIEEKKWL